LGTKGGIRTVDVGLLCDTLSCASGVLSPDLAIKYYLVISILIYRDSETIGMGKGTFSLFVACNAVNRFRRRVS
jgi:hypothetical protein